MQCPIDRFAPANGHDLLVKSDHGKSTTGCPGVMHRSKGAEERLDELVVRALNKIKKPSTAEEITELLNRELGPEDRPFDAKAVETWLLSARRKALPLFWLTTRPRR
jgi:hypothetical protein